MLKKKIKTDDACFKVMWDIILHHLIQKRLLLVSHLHMIFFYCIGILLCIVIMYFCATSFQLAVTHFWRNMAECLSGVNGSKSLRFSSWHEVGTDLVCEHRASYHHSCGFASKGWRKPRAVTRAPSVGLRYWTTTAAFHPWAPTSTGSESPISVPLLQKVRLLR